MTKKIYITTDFSSNLWMFNLNQCHIKRIKKLFPEIEIKFINVDKKNITLDDKTLIYWGTRFKSDFFKKLPNLKWIHFGSVGTEKIRLIDLMNKKITITNSDNTATYSIKNLILMYLFDVERQLLITNKIFKTRNSYEQNFQLTKNVKSSRILICGFGNISRALIDTFDNLNLNYDVLSNQKIESKKMKFYKYKNLSKIIKNYDIILNNLPLNIYTRKIFSKNVINEMRENTTIISIGRYKVFNESLLYKFFEKNKKASLYIDLPEKDILHDKFFKITKLKNVYLTPHIGGYTKSYWEKQIYLFTRNLSLFLSNKKLMNTVNQNKKNFS